MILEINTLVELIQIIGLPSVVILWFMFRTDKIIKENTKAIIELKSVISILPSIIRKNN